MATSVNFCSLEQLQVRSDSDLMVIVDTKEAFTSSFHLIAKKTGINDGDVAFVVSIAESRLTASADNTSSVEIFVQGITSTSPPRRVILALLPFKYGRHNTPSRSHSVASLVKSHKGSKKDLIIVLAPPTSTFCYPQAMAAARQFPLHSLKSDKTDKTDEKGMNVTIVLHCPEGESCHSESFQEIGNGIRLAQRLVDTPPNILHTDEYVEECRIVASSVGCTIQVIAGQDLEQQGFGGLWGVGKASEHLPALVVLSHIDPHQVNEKSTCLVGKGIVYDTGGLSIKTPGTSMAGMKTDMGGSAAVLGAFKAAVMNGVKGNFHALLCIAENSVGPLSTRPDDVHVMLSGKTVEVNNTDAEGRLVLSDGCYYASKYLNPKVIIDIATLTGGQLVATGRKHAAIYCNDEALETLAVAAGKKTGDLVHPVPYCPEFYKPEYRSEVADMKNSVADRMNAQASCAAQFIGNNIEDFLSTGGLWLHIDMAGPACVGERATGYGVALLHELLIGTA